MSAAALALLAFALSLATFIEVLDSTVTNVAVPAIAGGLGVSTSQGTWVISSYAVAAAIAVPLTGWLARRVGETRLFVAAIVLFTLTSALCGLSNDFHLLVLFRALQGLFSGPMVPLSQTLLLRAFTPQRRTAALALWGITVLLAPIFGPVVGGWIVDNYTWQWIFLINLPIGVFSFVVCALMLRPEPRTMRPEPIDLVGIILLAVGVGALQATLDLGHEAGWFESRMIIVLALVAGISLTTLVAWESGERFPVVDLALFRDRTFSFSVLILSLGMMSFSVTGVIFPLWLQSVMGYSAYQAGLAMAPLGVLALLVSILVGIFSSRFDARLLVMAGFWVFAGVLWWDAQFTLTMSFRQVILPGLVMGIGLPLFFIPLTTASLSRVPDDKLAAASSLSNFLRTLSAAMGTAISVTLWDDRANYHYGVVSEAVNAASVNTAGFRAVLDAMGLQGRNQLDALHKIVLQQAYMMATSDVFYLACLTCLVLSALIWLTRPRRGVEVSLGH